MKKRSRLRRFFLALFLGISFFLILFCAQLLTKDSETSSDTLHQGFLDPPHIYSPMPFWFWNGKMEGPKIQEQIRKMVGEHVYGAFLYGFNTLETPYLSEEWWQAIGAGLEESKHSGFSFNFVDEYAWPSGEARNIWMTGNHHSEVLSRNPEYQMKSLAFKTEIFKGPQVAAIQSSPAMQAVVAARWLGGKRIDGQSLRLLSTDGSAQSLNWSVPEGEWIVVSFFLEPSMGFDGGHVDLLNPDAMKLFFDLTYGEFHRRFGSYFGNTVQFGFSDHEGDYGYRIAWTPRLFQEFQMRKHYDLRKFLPLLIFEGGDFSTKARCDYLDTVTQLYSEAFWQGLTNAAQELGIGRTGHGWEETLQFGAALEGNLFAVERGLNPVGVDSLSDSGRQALCFKVAQSVADFEGRRFLCEHEGLHGTDSYLDLEGIRQVTNAIATWGVDIFVPHAFNYDAARANIPPDWINQPYWPYFHYYADYVRRLSFMNGESQHVAPILLHYPMTSIWAHMDPVFSGEVEYQQVYDPKAWKNITTSIDDYYTRLILELVDHQWDHAIADDDYLERAKVEGSELVIGPQRFKAVVLPPLTTMRRSTLKKLIDFYQAGGTVFAIRTLPDSSPEAGGNDVTIRGGIAELFGPEEGRHAGTFIERQSTGGGKSCFVNYQVDTLIERLDAHLAKDVRVMEGPETHLPYQHRHKLGQHYYWIVNDTERSRVNKVLFSQQGVPEKWDALTGERTPLFYINRPNGTEVRLTFAPWDAYYVVFRPLTKARQEVELVKTNAESLEVVSRDDHSIRMHVVAMANPIGAEVVLRQGGQVYEGKTSPSPLTPVALENDWRFRPQPERISIPYARIRDSARDDGPASGWAQKDFDDTDWSSLWLSESQNTIRDWNLVGPFSNEDDRASLNALPPEQSFDVGQEFTGVSGERLRWKQYFGDEPTLQLGFGRVDIKNGAYDDNAHIVQFDRILSTHGKVWIVCYAHTYLYSPKTQNAQLILGADNNASLWLNQKLIFQNLRHPFWYDFNDNWANRIPVELQAGWNQVLVKVGLGKATGSSLYGFTLRVADSSGNTLHDVVSSLAPTEIKRPPPDSLGYRWYRLEVPPGCVSLNPLPLARTYRLFINGVELHHSIGQTIDLRKHLDLGRNILAICTQKGERLSTPVEFQTGFTPFSLKPWTVVGLANFSGTGIYETQISLPISYHGQRLLLDLGRVGSVAEVYLNEVKVGTAVWRPYRFDISQYVKPGSNRLKILVTNTEANRRAVGSSHKNLAKIDLDGLEGPVSIIPYFDGIIECETRAEVTKLKTHLASQTR